MPGDEQVEFEWDDSNTGHLKMHRVLTAEFEQVINSEPLYIEYQEVSGEERYKALGETDNHRILVVVFTIRGEKIRAVTAYPATKRYKELYLKQ